MLQGFAFLILFKLLGEALVSLAGLPIPGPVIGMLLLFLWLQLRGGASAPLHQASHQLIQNMGLLFLPAGVGLFFLPASLQREWPAILGAILGGTLISMLFTAWLIRLLGQRKSGAGASDD